MVTKEFLLGRLNDLGKARPDKLWYRGKWRAEIFDKCVAVVGSRQMTEYGRRAIDKLVPGLVEEGYTIVSGFMYGVDQTAHAVCAECGGRTVAVLGWGIEIELEGRDKKLAEKIVDSGGVIISEWTDQKGTLWTFPMRNRIIAALTSRIYVVEAAVKSGSMITVEWGRKLKREIWAVPGPVTGRVSQGTNKLIADGVARMWVPGDRISQRKKSITRGNDSDVYSLLENEALTADELVRLTGRTAEEVGVQLTMMMLKDDVVEKDGKYYIGS